MKTWQKYDWRSGALWRLVLPFSVILAFCFALWAHEGHKALPTKGARVDGDTVYLTAEAHKALGLTTTQVGLDDLERTVTATATVVAPWKQQVFVTTKVGGKLERIFCRPGDFVKAGQKLAEIESLVLENEQWELIQTKLELELAQQTLDRAASLGTMGIVPERDVRAAQTIKREKTSALEVTRRKLTALGLSHEVIDKVLRTEIPVRIQPIQSPVSGFVIHSDENLGRIVEPTEHLFDILDLSTVWVQGMVVEAETYRLKRGQPARITLAALPGQTLDGSIDGIALQADPATRAVPVWINLKNPDPSNPVIRPGMFGSVQIVTDHVDQQVTCPSAAIITAGAETYVFVQQKPPTKDTPGEYLKRNVVLGLRTRDNVEVQAGLFPGDEVVLTGGHQLSSFYVQGTLTLTGEAQRNIKLRLDAVKQRPIENIVTVDGTVEIPPDRKALASCRIGGKVTRILVDVGQQVSAGQVLAEVESLEFQELQLETVQTQARLPQLKELVDRAQSLKSVIAQQELLQREAEYRKAEIQLRGLRRKLEAIGLAEEDVSAVVEGKLVETVPVRSPIDGHMVRGHVIPGQVVKAENPLFEIHDMTKVSVRGFVFEKDLPKISLDQPVRVRLASDPSFLASATLSRTNYVLTSTERILSIWVEIDNPEQRLKDNMLARVTVTVGVTTPVTAVPEAAVIHDGSAAYVFVKIQGKPNTFDRRAVTLGQRDDQFVEITHGLTPGESIAIGGVQELRTAYALVR